MLNKNNFPADDINAEMVNAMLFVIPCAIVSLAAIFATMLICTSSYARELSLVKASLKTAKKDISGQMSAVSGQQATKEPNSQNEKILLGARLTLAVIAVVFIVVGIFNGGMADVLQKAINICTECIGLG